MSESKKKAAPKKAAPKKTAEANPARLTLDGKHSSICLDADSGGIFITQKEKGEGEHDRHRGLCLIAGDNGFSYLGFYDGVDNQPGIDACDVAISIDSNGGAFLQVQQGKDQPLAYVPLQDLVAAVKVVLKK